MVGFPTELAEEDLVLDDSASSASTPSGGHVHAGVISDIDARGHFGLIESDDGEIVLFGRESLQPNAKHRALRVGQRVEFTIDKVEPALHASSVIPERHR